MVVIKSERAKNLLIKPLAFESNIQAEMKKYPGSDFDLWVGLERDQQNVKRLSFSGQLQDYERVLFEAVAALMKGRPMSFADNLSLRECEAYLRDRNSQEALEHLNSDIEQKFKKFFQWLRALPHAEKAKEYQYAHDKRPFRELKLMDKIRELKAFLNSVETQQLYSTGPMPELIDVEDLTVYVQVPYHSDRDKALFEELHILGVSTFQEESLNFIPEA